MFNIVVVHMLAFTLFHPGTGNSQSSAEHFSIDKGEIQQYTPCAVVYYFFLSFFFEVRDTRLTLFPLPLATILVQLLHCLFCCHFMQGKVPFQITHYQLIASRFCAAT